MLSLLSSESIIQIEKISPDDVHLPDVMNGVMCNDDSAACDEMALVLFCQIAITITIILFGHCYNTILHVQSIFHLFHTTYSTIFYNIIEYRSVKTS